MRNLRKFTAVVIALALVLTSMTAAFAATDFTAVNGEKAIVLNEMGLYAGINSTEFDPDLDSNLTRAQSVVLLLQLFGLKDEADAMEAADVEAALADFSDAADVPDWSETSIAYALTNDIMSGNADKTLAPKANVLGAQFATMLVKAMGYTVEDWTLAVSQLADVNGSEVADEYAEESLTRDAAVGYMFGTLTAETAEGTTVIANLIAENPEIEAAALAAGLLPAVTATALDVSSAVAVNSKVVEVSLGTAATAADVAAATFTVKDAAAKEFKVVSAALAPWSTDGKSVLVTLEANTTAGTLYTITLGTKSINFGGKAADTTAPTVSKVESTDFNQIKVTFSEPVLLGGTVTTAMKYTPKTALAATDIAYASSSTITVATDAQAAILYGAVVNGFKDLAGNTMTEDTAKTYIGKAKSTTVPKIDSISVVDSLSVKVVFNEKMDDVTSIDLTKYAVALKYAPKTALEVTSVVKDTDNANTVILTFATDTATSLYEVTVAAGVTTKYGVASTASSPLTFIGAAKDVTKLGTPAISTKSNTKLTLDFGDAVADKVDAATTQDMFSIKLKYSPFTELAITSISKDKEVVTINTAAQASSLYEIVIKSGLKDAKGNATTEDMKPTFVGQAVAAKITKIGTIVNGDSGTTLTLTFDRNVGAGAFDVANYSINGGIGYPSKAEAVTDFADKVKLTIPATTLGTKYTITVKNVSNLDGIAMDAAGISKTFIGTGAAAGLAQLVAVQTIDSQTIKVYFDRDVTDSKIAGVIWASNAIKNSIFTVDAAVDFALTDANTYAYQDATDKTALVIRVSGNNFKAASKDTTLGAFKLVGSQPASGLNTDNDKLVFVPSDADMAGIAVVNVQAINNQTLKVYFDQPTYIDDETFATLESTVIATPTLKTTTTIAQAVVVAGTNNMEYTLKLSAAMVNTNKDFTLKINAAKSVLLGKINDTSTALNFVTLVDEDGTAGDPIVVSRVFAPSFTAPGDITDIAVQMTDSKTIVVYYPEAMNEALVENPAYYVVKDGATSPAAVTMVIGNITYDTSNNTAKIVLKQAISAPASGAFLYFSKLIANVTGLGFVKNVDAQVTKQFAVSSAAAAEVGISAVTVTGASITIKLDQALVVADANTIITTGTAILANFSITKQISGSDVAITPDQITGITYNGTDSFTITLNAIIPTNTGVTVKGILTDVAKIEGLYNAEGLNDASEFVVVAQ